jgi:hypothetical protein
MEHFQSPLLGQYLAHWRSLCLAGEIPTTEDYMDRIDPKVATFLMIFDILPADMVVRFQGLGISERRRIEQTGQSWFALNPHLNAGGVMTNVWEAVRTPCGVWTEAVFVTNAARRLRVEALSLPVATKGNRPPRLLNMSVGLDAVDFDERATGWQGDVKVGWYDIGFGVPAFDAAPVS